jgi:uncharacterized protein YcgL (UPF0745 family)
MYLYVDKTDDMDRVPADLLKRFGKPELAMTLLLHAQRELARVDVSKVLQEIEAQGFFLQIPPRPDEIMRQIHENNSKMGR